MRTKPQRLPFQEYKQIYERVPRFCVDLIIQTKDGVVLTKRDIEPYKGMWHLPGGTLLLRESIKSAAQRIAKEEIGVKIQIKKQIGIMEFPNEKGTATHSISVALLANIISGRLRGSSQAANIKIFKKVPNNTVPTHKKFLLNNILPGV